MEALYTASATAHGGRNGTVESSDGILDLDLTMPKELGGPGDDGATNPEQLFAAGYSACFENALRRVAGRQKKRSSEDAPSRPTSASHVVNCVRTTTCEPVNRCGLEP